MTWPIVAHAPAAVPTRNEIRHGLPEIWFRKSGHFDFLTFLYLFDNSGNSENQDTVFFNFRPGDRGPKTVWQFIAAGRMRICAQTCSQRLAVFFARVQCHACGVTPLGGKLGRKWVADNYGHIHFPFGLLLASTQPPPCSSIPPLGLLHASSQACVQQVVPLWRRSTAIIPTASCMPKGGPSEIRSRGKIVLALN